MRMNIAVENHSSIDLIDPERWHWPNLPGSELVSIDTTPPKLYIFPHKQVVLVHLLLSPGDQGVAHRVHELYDLLPGAGEH